MTRAETAEAVGTEILVTEPESYGGFTDDKVQAIIALAEKSEALGKALDSLRTFVLKRALPGDFVAFTEKGSEEKVLSVSGAGAERIRAPLGISFTNWTSWKETFTDDNGQGYDWWYAADVEWKGQRLRVEGRAGTRDRFFGREGGAWKELKDIREADIRTAARRNTVKEGVTVLLGLRRIPLSAAEKLGLNLGNVKTVEFDSKSSGGKAGEKLTMATTVKEVKQKTIRGGEKKVYVIVLENGRSPETFSESLAKTAKSLIGKPVTVEVETDKYAGKLRSIVEGHDVAKTDAKPAADQPGDAQEPTDEEQFA